MVTMGFLPLRLLQESKSGKQALREVRAVPSGPGPERVTDVGPFFLPFLSTVCGDGVRSAVHVLCGVRRFCCGCMCARADG